MSPALFPGGDSRKERNAGIRERKRRFRGRIAFLEEYHQVRSRGGGLRVRKRVFLNASERRMCKALHSLTPSKSSCSWYDHGVISPREGCNPSRVKWDWGKGRKENQESAVSDFCDWALQRREDGKGVWMANLLLKKESRKGKEEGIGGRNGIDLVRKKGSGNFTTDHIN